MQIVAKQPAHRPSRRDDIVDAAIQVFADKGFAEAAISDIAEIADVAVTAVYYHFSGKDDLFAAAMRKSLDAISQVVLAARPTGAAADVDGLEQAIDAVWDWVDDNPYGASLVHIQLPGAIRQVATIRQEFLDFHEQRSFDYLANSATVNTPLSRGAVGTLTMRSLIDVLMAVHAMRMADGPLSELSPASVRTEIHKLARRMLDQEQPASA